MTRKTKNNFRGHPVSRTRHWNADRRRYTASAPTLDVDIVEDHEVSLESLAVGLEGNTQGVRMVGRCASWTKLVPHLRELSDVVILDVPLGDSILCPGRYERSFRQGRT